METATQQDQTESAPGFRSDFIHLGRKSMAYIVGHVATRAISFLLLPLYTNALAPADYAVLSLAFTFLAFSGIVFHFGIDSALLRYYTGVDRLRQKEVFSTVYFAQLVVTAALAAILLLARKPLGPLLLGAARPDWIAILVGIIIMDSLWAHPMHVLRAEGRAKTFAAVSLLNAGVLMAGNIILVAGYGLGITGALLSNLAASCVMLLVNLPTVLKNTSPGAFSKVTFKVLLVFGLPFLPAGLFTMIMELSDRYFLRWLTDMPTLGLYSASHKLGALMLLLIIGFSLGWQPFYLKRGQQPGAPLAFARITTYLISLLAWALLTIGAWIDRLIRIPLGPITVFGPEYWSATGIVPLILLGYFFFATYVLQMPAVNLTGRTKWVMFFRGSGAATKLLLNLLLIPIWGIMGAASATAMAFAVMTTVAYVINRKIYPVPYEWLQLVRLGLLLGLGIFMLYFIPDTIGRNLLLTIWVPAGLALTGGITQAEWRQLKALAGRS
ncbi:MAG: lipopolysaccharide biosynthesis protein [Candidatus Marinimicrobia bacterium]|nr:lipopolysaccharide biosynthesis protein [Candidatus Neomarinimicrobiota bacterium]